MSDRWNDDKLRAWFGLPSVAERDRRLERAQRAYDLRDELPDFADRLTLMNGIWAGEVEHLYTFPDGSLVTVDGRAISVTDYLSDMAQRTARSAQSAKTAKEAR